MSLLPVAVKEARFTSLYRKRLDSAKRLVQDACKDSLGTIYQSAILYFEGRGNTVALEQLFGFVLLLSVEMCL